jgi:aryl-alcohol dehydrogenase-like predicted oxidoreductase
LYGVVDALEEVSKDTGKIIPQVALNWLLQRPTVANVIIGARDEEQLRDQSGRSWLEALGTITNRKRRRPPCFRKTGG